MKIEKAGEDFQDAPQNISFYSLLNETIYNNKKTLFTSYCMLKIYCYLTYH